MKNVIGFLRNDADDDDDSENKREFSLQFKELIWNAQLQKREIIINGMIDDSIIERAVLQIHNFNCIDELAYNTEKNYEPEPIKIFINSFGGDIDEAFCLISAIESSNTPITTIAMGKCMSAAMLILLAGHHRVSYKYSTIMYHQGSAGFAGEFSKHLEYANYWHNVQTMVENFVKENTKISKQQLDNIFNQKTDWYMTPVEAFQLGVLDGIIGYTDKELTALLSSKLKTPKSKKPGVSKNKLEKK